MAFYHVKLEDAYAQIKVNELGKTADIFLDAEMPDAAAAADVGSEGNAKHEAIHLLLNRLEWLGKSRVVGETDFNEENEAIVNRLMKVL